MFWTRAGACLLVLACPSTMRRAGAQDHAIEITYEDALRLARQGLAAQVAEARVEEARAHERTAGRWRRNPDLVAMAGPRRQRDGSQSVDVLVRVVQSFPLGRTGARREALAQTRTAVRGSERDDAMRRRLRETGARFVRALHAAELLRIATAERERAASLLEVARRRHETGDGSGLDLALAEVALVRTDAEHEQSLAELNLRQGALAQILGTGRVRARGSIRDIALDRPRGGHGHERADVRALREAVAEAEADGRLGRAGRAPDLTLGVQYQREEGADVVRGVVGLSLPIFERDQGRVARAHARRERVADELALAEHIASTEIATTAEVADALAAAVDRHDAADATLRRAEALALRSYESGATRLADLLAVRRELAATRRALAVLLRDAALATTDLRGALDDFAPRRSP